MTADLSRDERRQRSESAILEAAGELFAETGYERTTIRTVAGLVKFAIRNHLTGVDG